MLIKNINISWWFGVTQNLEERIKECPTRQQTIRLLPTPLPDHPWEKVATDLFHYNGVFWHHEIYF